MSDDPPDERRDVLADGMGPDRAHALRAELAALGLAVVASELLAELERDAAAHRRMRRLVEGDDV